MGIFGELGSLMAEFKKQARDGTSYRSFGPLLTEEAGDLLWYLTILGVDLRLPLHELMSAVYGADIAAEADFRDLDKLPMPPAIADGNLWLIAAGRAGRLAEAAEHSPMTLKPMLVETAIAAIRGSKISLAKAVRLLPLLDEERLQFGNEMRAHLV